MFYVLYVVLARCPCIPQNINMIKGPNLQIWRGVWVSFFKIAIVSFLSARYKSDGLYCRMAGTPSSPTLFFIPTLIKSIVGDDCVPAILQYRQPDLYPMDMKQTMAILKKDTHTPLRICKLGLPLIILMFCGTYNI